MLNTAPPSADSTAPQTPRPAPKILFIPVEFHGWGMARSFPYDIQLAFEEGFQASGADVFTLPALWGHSSSSRASWLGRARTLLAGRQFDQIWVTLVHTQLEDDFVEWLASLAPVRVGLVFESLEYTPEECQAHPPYKYRRGHVERQMRSMTHVLTWDEYDAARLNAEGVARALWWPGCVPARVLLPPTGCGEKLPAAFCGALYGERARWMARDDLRQLLARATGPEDNTGLPQKFDKLQEENCRRLLSTIPVAQTDLDAYLASLRQLRREVFDLWMASLPKACGQINLPSLVKAYGVRVVEGMAAGCPVISWDVPNRPRTRNLFRDGGEILLFRRDHPEELAAHIRYLQREPAQARQLAARAQAKVAAHHTFEIRVRQVLDWIATGQQPDYGEITASSPSFSKPLLHDPDPNPNTDETARWTRISTLLEKIAAGKPLRILDVCCGRGWLTNLAGKFGECEGVEAAPEIVAQAARLFPHLRLTTGSIDTLLNAPDRRPYDVVLASELIEYVTPGQQSEFIRKLGRLLKPGGHVVLTTPRGESMREWTRLWGHIGDPGVEWLTEPALRHLFEEQNFSVAGRERVLFDAVARQYVCGEAGDDCLAIYQVWAFQFAAQRPAPAIRPEIVLADYHRAWREAADRALQLLSDHPVLLTARASALLELGEVEAARQALVWQLALDPNDAPARRLLARALRQLGRAKEAETQTRRAGELEAAPPAPPPLISVKIPRQQSRAFSFLHHAQEAKTPDGTPARLDTRTVTINQRSAPCVFLQPSARMRFSVPCADPGRFTCAIAIQPEAWNKPTVAGCEFFIQSNGREIFRREIHPRRLPTERRWHEVEVDIPAASGPSHEFVLRTRAVGPAPDFRWAVWCDPVFHPQPAPIPQNS